MNTALVSAWQNQSLTSETEAQAVMEAICAFCLLSLMINGLSVRQLIGGGFYGWPFVCLWLQTDSSNMRGSYFILKINN